MKYNLNAPCVLISDDYHIHPNKYYLKNGRKHLLNNLDVDSEIFYSELPVVTLAYNKLLKIPLGAPIFNININSYKNAKTSSELESFFLKTYIGKGIELGSGQNPLPVPIDCNIDYAVLNSTHMDSNINKVKPKYIGNLEIINKFDDNLDFIVASDTLEFSNNPINTISQLKKKLKLNGRLFLCIKNSQYIHNTKVTNLNHIISDFKQPDYNSDNLHLMEYICKNKDLIHIDNIYMLIQEHLQEKQTGIMYHYFNSTSINKLIKWYNTNICRWSKINIYSKFKFNSNLLYLEMIN